MLYDQLRPEERLLIEAAKRKSLKLGLHDSEKLYLNINKMDQEALFEEIVLQRCLSYFRSVINSSKIASVCGNKLLASIKLEEANIPTPHTVIAFSIEAALKALDEIGYPAVLKPIIGSWGRLIAPLRDIESAKAILEDRENMFPIYQIYYIQEMIQRPSRDIRCFVIGTSVVAAIYRYAPKDDWRTNTARGGHVESCKVTSNMEELALRAAEVFGEGVYGVDMMESENGLTIHEVNYTTEFRNSVPATGVDIPGLMLDFAIQKVRK
jgi:[lysine-biosynthesis-protein LysW]--L-2-aminoadipate ligase